MNDKTNDDMMGLLCWMSGDGGVGLTLYVDVLAVHAQMTHPPRQRFDDSNRSKHAPSSLQHPLTELAQTGTATALQITSDTHCRLGGKLAGRCSLAHIISVHLAHDGTRPKQSPVAAGALAVRAGSSR